MSLYAKINKEYVNHDLLANKEVVKRQFAHVATASKEYVPSSQLDQNMMFNFDKLYEDFRASIETVITLDFEDALTLTKSYEIIKKYNYLSSYLKNIVKLSSMKESDSDKIETKFNELIPNLEIFNQLAITNNFVDKGEIKSMLDSIKNMQYDRVSASKTDESITSRYKEKEQLIKSVSSGKERSTELEALINTDKYHQNDQGLKDRIKELKDYFEIEQDNIKEALKSSNKISKPERDEYVRLFKENEDKLKQLDNYITTQEDKVVDVIANNVISNQQIFTGIVNDLERVGKNKSTGILSNKGIDELTEKLYDSKLKQGNTAIVQNSALTTKQKTNYKQTLETKLNGERTQQRIDIKKRVEEVMDDTKTNSRGAPNKIILQD